MALSIIGLGPVCALGSGVENFRFGLKGQHMPRVAEKLIEGPLGNTKLSVYEARFEGIDRFIPRRSLRRIDNFAKMALLSTHLALEDAGVRIKNSSRTGIIVGSGNGPVRTTFDFLDGIIEDGDHCALPTHFANSVHNALASHISIFLDIQGPCTTITCFDSTVANVVMTARNWLEEGAVDTVIAGFGDEYCDVLGYSAVGFGATEREKIEPFEYGKCTFLPGEGYLTFVFSAEPGEKMYGVLDGIGMNLSAEETEKRLRSLSGPLIVSAKGKVKESESYKKLDLSGKKVAAYSPLYGGMPVTSAFDIAAAAVFLEDGVVYRPPNGNAAETSGLNVIAKDLGLERDLGLTCLECSGKNTFNLYHLKK